MEHLHPVQRLSQDSWGQKMSANGGDSQHYKQLDPEPIDVIESWGLESDGYLMQAFQYLARARLKGQYTSDCIKAAWYMLRAAGIVLDMQTGTVRHIGESKNGKCE